MFKGYLIWDSGKQTWRDDEWLCGICEKEQTARDILWKFADGKPFDDNREIKVTRFYGKRKNEFTHGTELEKGDPGIAEYEWMRYASWTMT